MRNKKAVRDIKYSEMADKAPKIDAKAAFKRPPYESIDVAQYIRKLERRGTGGEDDFK